MDDFYVVGIRHAGRRLGVSPATLRRLERSHQLRVPRLPNGQRRYPEDLLREIAAILYGHDAARVVAPAGDLT